MLPGLPTVSEFTPWKAQVLAGITGLATVKLVPLGTIESVAARRLNVPFVESV
jgi:hypothetical protein